MPKDFSHQDLRGKSFKGRTDLTGANFSHADIRGTNFTNAYLIGANFSHVKAGLQTHQLIYVVLASSITIILIGLVSYIVGFYVNNFLNLQNIKNISSVGAPLALILLIVFLPVFYSSHLEFKETHTRGALSLYSSLINLVLGCLLLGIITILSANNYLSLVKVFFIMSILFLCLSLACAIGFISVAYVSFIGIMAWIGSLAEALILSHEIITYLLISLCIISIYFGFQSLSGKTRYYWFGSFLYDSASFGCTSFRSAHLKDANFFMASLYNTDFTTSNLKNTYFYKAVGIEYASFRYSYLKNIDIRRLVASGNGSGQRYINLSFTWINLAEVNLSNANLKKSDISGANLRQANLDHANLAQLQAVGTDFTGASFTGACLEAWNIDSTTKLEEVKCDYVFLLEHPDAKGNRERRPHDPDKIFQPGDFAKLYKKLMNTVQILLKSGMNLEAFNLAFQKIMAEDSEITFESIQSIEKKGEDVLITIQVPEGTDKAKIEREFDKTYALEIEARVNSALLEERDLRIQDIKYLAELGLAQKPPASVHPAPNIHTTINVDNDNKSEDKIMNDSTDNSRKIENKDGNVIGNILGDFGTISGTVAESINQLPDAPDTDKPSIKELLIELQAAIEADPSLKPEDKTEALEQLKALAEAGSNPKEGAMQKTAKTALTMLKGIISGLPSAATAIEACNKIIPAIALFFGL